MCIHVVYIFSVSLNFMFIYKIIHYFPFIYVTYAIHYFVIEGNVWHMHMYIPGTDKMRVILNLSLNDLAGPQKSSVTPIGTFEFPIDDYQTSDRWTSKTNEQAGLIEHTCEIMSPLKVTNANTLGTVDMLFQVSIRSKLPPKQAGSFFSFGASGDNSKPPVLAPYTMPSVFAYDLDKQSVLMRRIKSTGTGDSSTNEANKDITKYIYKYVYAYILYICICKYIFAYIFKYMLLVHV